MPDESGFTGKESVDRQKRMLGAEFGELVAEMARDLWADKLTIPELKDIAGKIMTTSDADLFFSVLSRAAEIEGKSHLVEHEDPMTGKTHRVVIKSASIIKTNVFKENFEFALYKGAEQRIHEAGEILTELNHMLSVRPRDKSGYEQDRPGPLDRSGL